MFISSVAGHTTTLNVFIFSDLFHFRVAITDEDLDVDQQHAAGEPDFGAS